ncbi:MAG: hypothetical protein Q9219_004765 [cf. Caloplaca sp. 3 TL-2023]
MASSFSERRKQISAFIAVNFPPSLRKPFASQPFPSTNPASAVSAQTATNKAVVVDLEASDTEGSLPDLDRKLEILQHQHAPKTLSNGKARLPLGDLPPTPESSPSKTNQHALRSIQSSPQTPTRIQPTRSASLLPNGRKRTYDVYYDSDCSEILIDGLRDPKDREEIEMLQEFFPSKSKGACRAALQKMNGDFAAAMSYLSNTNSNPFRPIASNPKPSNTQFPPTPNTTRAQRIASAYRVPPLATPHSTPRSNFNPPRRNCDISPFEAKRVKESIMRQVNWDEVACDVACNRRPGVYQRAVKLLLEGWVEAAAAKKEDVAR